MTAVFVTLVLLILLVPAGVWLNRKLKGMKKSKPGTALAVVDDDDHMYEAEIEVDDGPAHVIERTWVGMDPWIKQYLYKWRCKCGTSGKRYYEILARDDAREHIQRMQKSMATGGRFEW